MIVNFELPLKVCLSSNVLTSGKPFETFDVKSDLPSMQFYYRKFPIKNSFVYIFLFVNRFSKCLLNILRQVTY